MEERFGSAGGIWQLQTFSALIRLILQTTGKQKTFQWESQSCGVIVLPWQDTTQRYNEIFHCTTTCMCIYNLGIPSEYPIKIHCEYHPTVLFPVLKLKLSCCSVTLLPFLKKANVSLSFFSKMSKLPCVHNSTHAYHILLKMSSLLRK